MAYVRRVKKFVRIALPNVRQPPRRTTIKQLLDWAKSLPDTQKTKVRRMLACLDIRKVIKQDYRMTRALYTARDKVAAQFRSKNRRLFIKMGLIKPGDSHLHIHHKNGNNLDNRMSNLAIVDSKTHKKHHHNEHAERVCSVFISRLKAAGVI